MSVFSSLSGVAGLVPGLIPTGISAIRGFQLHSAAGLSATPNVSNTPVTIGGFNLTGFEAPQHLNVGGQQKLAVHDFPGGIRTIQSLGAFPPEEISWEGVFLGSNAWDRAYALDLLRVNGSSVDLLFGNWGYSGKIKHLEIIARHQWLCRYRIFFIPSVDIATPVTKPVTQNSTQIVNNSMGILSSNTPTTVFGGILPASVSTPVTSLMSSVSVALNSAGGVFSKISTAAGQEITGFASQVVSSVESIVNSSSSQPLDVAGSLLVGNAASNIADQVNVAPQVANTVVMNNPNLMQLAAQQYGDSSLWTNIASFNGLTDPMPTGTFTLNLPSLGGLI